MSPLSNSTGRSVAVSADPPIEPRSEPGIPNLLHRIKAEFLEMPGLKLTELQAQRLWSLDSTRCAALLGALVDAGFLFRTPDGAVMRAAGVAMAPPRRIAH